MSIPRLANLVFTWAINNPSAGIEDHLKKTYSIYALSRFLDVSYIHSSIPSDFYNDPSRPKHYLDDPENLARYNKTFHIKSDLESVNAGALVAILRAPDLGFLCDLRDKVKGETSLYIANITSCCEIVKRHPEMLHYIKDISPFKPLNDEPFKIVMHVRNGDLLAPEWTLPNLFYVLVALKIIHYLKELHISFVCELHIEFTSNTNQELFLKEFEVLPNLKIVINSDPIDSLQTLATADLLIASCYSFSYLGALLNKKGIIVYHPSLEHPLSEWVSTANGASFEKRIVEKCKRWKADKIKLCCSGTPFPSSAAGTLKTGS